MNPTGPRGTTPREMFIVWRGRGWLPIAMLLGGGALVEWWVESRLGAAYEDWPASVVMLATGALCSLLGRRWNRPGQPAAHTLFWIPLQWWGPLLALWAVANVVMRRI